MSLFAELQTKVRTLLKAAEEKVAVEKEGKKAAVPGDPGDPDKLQPDYRVGDASPTEEDAEDAKEETGKDEEEEEEDGGVERPESTDEEEEDKEGEKPTVGEEEDTDDQRPIAKGFDEFGNRDLTNAETRCLLKALEYGVTPPVAPEKIIEGGEDLKAVLDDIMALLVHQQEKLESNSAVMNDLLSEISRLKKGHEMNERGITKALEMMGNPTTAPADAPRGISKSFVPPSAPPAMQPTSGDLANQIFLDMKAGRMDSATAMAKCREARLGSS